MIKRMLFVCACLMIFACAEKEEPEFELNFIVPYGDVVEMSSVHYSILGYILEEYDIDMVVRIKCSTNTVEMDGDAGK